MPPRARTAFAELAAGVAAEDNDALAAEAQAADTAAVEVLELQQRLESTERELQQLRARTDPSRAQRGSPTASATGSAGSTGFGVVLLGFVSLIGRFI